MSRESNSINQSSSETLDPIGQRRLLRASVKCPGLTPGAEEIHNLAAEIPKSLAIYHYKQLVPCPWIVFVGGTGTGKSTLFNAFSGRSISDTGVERPKTFGAIVYVHQGRPIERAFPLPATQIERQVWDDVNTRPVAGTPGHLLILEHKRDDLSHLLLADTPDLDSVEAENRDVAEDLYLLSDAVVFVASQEKYADEVPYQFLLRILEDETPYFFLLNKADEQLSEEEVIGVLESQGITFRKDRVWLIPYAPSDTSSRVSESMAFRDFVRTVLSELSVEKIKRLRKIQHSRRRDSLKTRVARLLDLLGEEERAAQKWLSQLDMAYRECSRELIKQQKRRFTAESREYLQREIRKLFTKYDLLAKPRRFIRELLLTPFRLLGLLDHSTQKTHKDELLKIREKIDLSPVETAVERFNRVVLETLSPADETSPLFGRLRQADVVLKEEEVREHIWKEQDKLDEWLEETFRKLSQGIPKHKELGIYSTSILWGVLIISLEIVVGGGFSVIDAALDSALAPFVTKGATELFAYHEIQQVARKLAERYQEGLLSALLDQRDRYEHSLRSLLIPPKTMAVLVDFDFS
jgi:energy-coupling factor transporter ATP-binding protein EcfA2